jgi:hypothetical protein
MAGVLNTLNELMQGTGTTSGVLTSSTKHEDQILVSRFYNWRSGSYKGAYTRTAVYKLKADAPPGAVELISKTYMVPLLEKLFADGTLIEYEIDEMAVHTDSPAYFYVDFQTPGAEGQDKVLKALQDAAEANPLARVAFEAMIDGTEHRDVLVRGDATYK